MVAQKNSPYLLSLIETNCSLIEASLLPPLVFHARA